LRDANGNIEIAQKGDLYRPSDIVSQTPIPIPTESVIQQQPGISIAPVFNFGTMENKPSQVEAQAQVQAQQAQAQVQAQQAQVQVQEKTKEQTKDEPIDFNKLIIKKL
jgi:hypothetical protein